MSRVLILASVASMIEQFNMPNIQLLIDMGYKVDVACNFENGSTCDSKTVDKLKKNLDNLGVRYYQIDFERNITKIGGHKKAYNQVMKIMKENEYTFVHCHSPIGGVIGRICAKKTNTKVIYTAHGFHFFKGAPLKNWLMYYPVEKFCSYFTDVLITINKEDYALAQKKMRAKRVEYVPGIGIDIDRFKNVDINIDEKRNELEIPDDKRWIFAVGELSNRKNHKILIRAIANNESLYCTIIGKGDLKKDLQKLINELNIAHRVKLLGYRNDIKEICCAADVFVFPSLQEGLPVALMEAMAAGKPIVCSKIRGNTDLIDENKGGYLCDCNDIDGFEKAINELADNKELREKFGKYNTEKIKQFDISAVETIMKNIY